MTATTILCGNLDHGVYIYISEKEDSMCLLILYKANIISKQWLKCVSAMQ